MAIEEFSAPIPGESLTEEPGKWAWDKPPRFTKFEDALDTTMERVFSSRSVSKVLTMLDAGVDAESIARVVLFSGFMEGQYTPDVAVLMGQNVYEAVITIGTIGGIKNLKLENKSSSKGDTEFAEEMASLKFTNDMKNKPIEKIADKSKEVSMGLMAKPNDTQEEEIA
jgi:hypothetical protein|tara:strand:- start:354 stop:857 length:504 start_codon:yes stop_codon:yes gene_type:complete